MATNFLMIEDINRVESVVGAGNSGLGRCWKSSFRGFEVRGDKEMWAKSNAEESATNLERLDLDLFLWKVNPNPSL